MANKRSFTKKYIFVLAFVSNELLTLMPAHLAYSVSFLPRRVAFSTWRGQKDGWNDIWRSIVVVFPTSGTSLKTESLQVPWLQESWIVWSLMFWMIVPSAAASDEWVTGQSYNYARLSWLIHNWGHADVTFCLECCNFITTCILLVHLQYFITCTTIMRVNIYKAAATPMRIGVNTE